MTCLIVSDECGSYLPPCRSSAVGSGAPILVHSQCRPVSILAISTASSAVAALLSQLCPAQPAQPRRRSHSSTRRSAAFRTSHSRANACSNRPPVRQNNFMKVPNHTAAHTDTSGKRPYMRRTVPAGETRGFPRPAPGHSRNVHVSRAHASAAGMSPR